MNDIESAKKTREYSLDYDGHLHFMPLINWGKFRVEDGRKMMPLTVRLNHAVADGYLVAKVFKLLDDEIRNMTSK